MANSSNRNASSNTIPVHMNTTCPKFKAGDAVLCPFLGYGAKRFILHKYEYHTELLCIHAHHSSIAFDSNGYFIQADDAQIGNIETNDYTPSLFIDTPENRQYIAGLYGNSKAPEVITTPQSPLNRKVIDLTQGDDDEVIVLSAFELSNIACEVLGVSETLEDLKQLLYIIFNRQLITTQEVSLTRLSYEACETWVNIMDSLLTELNKLLVQTSIGIVGGE